MVMVIRCNILQRTGLTVSNVLHKILHLAPGTDIQFCLDVSVNSVIDHYVDHFSAKIHNSAEFILQIRICMMHLKDPTHCMRGVEDISPVGGDHIIPLCTYQCNILHDHLSTDLKCFGQSASRDRPVTVFNLIQDRCPAF